MIILDIAAELKKRGYDEVPIPDLADVIRDGFKTISDMAMKEGEGFGLQIPGFGSFRVIKKSARVAFNPKTKQKVNVPEKLSLKFKTSPKLRVEIAESTPAAKKTSKKVAENPTKKKKKK